MNQRAMIATAAASLMSLAMLAGLFAWAMAQDRRLTQVEEAVKREHEINVSQDQERSKSRDELREDIKAINAKLDRIMEGRNR